MGEKQLPILMPCKSPTEGSFMEIWDSIGPYLRSLISIKHPSWGFILHLKLWDPLHVHLTLHIKGREGHIGPVVGLLIVWNLPQVADSA